MDERRCRVARMMVGVVLLMAMAPPAARAAEGWSNSLKPAGAPAKAITLVEDARPSCAILAPDEPTSIETKAADDLRHWIEQMTGCALPASRQAGGPAVRIETDAKLAPEAYRISVEGNDLVLAGGSGRGPINAVYALLEEDMGCRFYTNDDIRLPKTATLTVAPVPRMYGPKLILRDPFYFASFDPAWSLRNRTNAPDAKVPEEFGGHVDYGGLFVHTHAALLPPDKYFKGHPEYYIQDAAGKRYPAQICTSNPEAARIVTQNVLDILAKNPNTEIISVSKNDSGGDQICHCPDCEKLRQAEGSEMANQLVLVNHVAEAVEKKYPNVLVDTLAYLDTIPVPKTMRPRKNVIIRVCNDAVGAWSRPFTPARQLPVAKIVQQWSAVHDKLSIWDYNINFSHFLAPMPNMDVIADNIRFWVDNHAIGVMTQGGYQSTSERDELRSWVIAKLMWDPSRDEQALVHDFIYGHFGKAAPMIAEYDALLVQAGKDDAKELANPPGGIRYPMSIGFLSKDFLDKATEIFQRAESAAAGNEALLHRVERYELPILYVKLAQGPVTKDLLSRFETIARREKVDWLLEWQVRLDQQLDAWRKQLPPETPPATTQSAGASSAAAPITISRGEAAHSYQAFPDACRLKNGDILCVFYAGYGHVSLEADDFPNGGRICMVRSSDEGKTWSKPEVLFDDADDNRDPHIAQLDDGSLVCTFFSWQHTGPRYKSHKDFDWKTWRKAARNTGVQMVRSTDGGKTWEKQARSLFPDWVCSAPVRQLPDGTCILGLYQGNGIGINGPDYRPGTVRSTDRCNTWEQPVVIDKPENVSLDAETDIIRLRDGRLFAALRSGKQNMHYALSEADGRSWSKAADIGFKGHCPHLNRLSTGEIILCHRLPQTSIHISSDDAKSWQGPYVIDDVQGAYPATVELKDKSVLIVYYTEGAGSAVRARRFKLKPDGIEFLPL